MAKIEDLIAQIPDERLRRAIGGEVKALKKTKRFGLVFEEHLPERVRLPCLPVSEGELVALKRESGNQLWQVRTIRKSIATCDKAVEGYQPSSELTKEFPVADLVVVRNFGGPIYPALVPVDRDWALCIPYELGGMRPFYPDFIIVRKKGRSFDVDVIEPHDDSRVDTWAKAKGLAAFADLHGIDFGRLMIVRKKGEQFQSIDLNDPTTRRKARKMQSQNELESLFS